MTTAATSDEDLMLEYASGDARAFDLLYERSRGPLWRYVSRHLRDESVTADVFQEVWERVIAHRRSYEPRAKFSTWLYRIAHNCCVDHWRRTGRRRQREIHDEESLGRLADESSPSPVELADEEQAAAALRAALGLLPEVQREAFLLYAEAGLDLRAIGEITGVGAETAKSRLRYAVAKLRRALAGRRAAGADG